jgi:hypothetical protein
MLLALLEIAGNFFLTSDQSDSIDLPIILQAETGNGIRPQKQQSNWPAA